MNLRRLRLGTVKIVAGMAGLLVVAATWPVARWLGPEPVLVGVVIIAVAGFLLAGMGLRRGSRQAVSADRRVQALNDQVAALRDELRARTAALTETQRRLEAQLDARVDRRVRQRLTDPLKVLGEVRHQVGTLQREIADAAASLDEMRDAAAAKRRRVDDLEATLVTLGRDAGSIDDLRAATIASLQELGDTLEAVRTHLGEEGRSSGVTPGTAWVDRHDPEQLRESGLFDEDWYREHYGHELGGSDPLEHYLEVGWRRGNHPSAVVDVADLSRRLLAGSREPVGLLLARAEAGLLPRLDEPPVPLRADDPSADRELRWRYLLEGGYRHEHTFVLTRIIGNDLPPRHVQGQSLANLRFILEHEPELANCERRFVLNRILDPDEETALIELLEAHDLGYIRIPFSWEDYRRVGWRFNDFPEPGYAYGPRAWRRAESSQLWLLDHVYHDKNLYAMNNNGARNVALEDGRERARWVLPFDGNCFFTTAAWDELTSAIRQRPHLPYVLVPMVRATDNDDVLDPMFAPNAVEEPQIVIRADAREQFDPNRRYGRRPKAELFQRLEAPGMWDNWVIDPWEPPIGKAPERGRFHQASYVVRLASGRPDLEVSASERGRWRLVTIQRRIDELDRRAAVDRFRPDAGVLLPDLAAGDLRGDVEAEPVPVASDAASSEALEALLDAVADRTPTSAPSGQDPADEGSDAAQVSRPGRGSLETALETVGVMASEVPDDLAPGWAAAVIDAGMFLCRRAQLPPTVDEALRQLAQQALAAAQVAGFDGVVGYGDTSKTVWQLLDQLAGYAYLDDLEGVIATARIAEDVRAMRHQVFEQTAADRSTADLTEPAQSGPDDHEVERAGWAMLGQALARVVPDHAPEQIFAVSGPAALAAVRAVAQMED